MFSYLHFLIFILALASEIIGALGAVGSSSIFVPLAQKLLDFQTVLALTGLLHVFGNTGKIYFFFQHIHWRVALQYGAASLLFTAGGAWLTRYFSAHLFEHILGGLLAVSSAYMIFFPNQKLPDTKITMLLGGSLSGFATGLVGSGGAIRAAGLAALNLEKNALVATSAAIDMANDAARSAIYLASGYLRPEFYSYIPYLLAAALIGSFTAKKILDRISVESYRMAVLGLVLLVGLYMLLG